MRVVGQGEFHPEELINRDVRDADNQVAAGLIIETDLIDLAYDASSGMVKMNHSPGRDFLFLQANERAITIMAKGYAPLKITLISYGIKLVGGQSWLLKITADKKSELIPITIKTTPPGAAIIIDGENKGQIKTATINEGLHDLRIELEGYAPVNQKIKVNINSAYFEYKLESKTLAAVLINSVPDGAKIFIDNIEKGTTNKTLFLYPSEYNLKLTLPGYMDISKRISVSEKKENNFDINLARNIGVLALTVEPRTAVVEINKELQKQIDEINLAPGKYQLTVSAQGFYSFTETVEIKLEEKNSRNIKLKEMTGALQLSISPSDAQVELLRGSFSNDWTGAKLLKDINVGSYIIKAKRNGYTDYSGTLTIDENKTTSFDINLAKSTAANTTQEFDETTSIEEIAKKERPDLFLPRDEFENKRDYEARVAESREFTRKLEKIFTARRAKLKLAKIEASKKEILNHKIEDLGLYNPDDQTFPIVINGQSGRISIPQNNAKNFKDNYKSAIVKAYSKLNDDLTEEAIYLTTVTDPNTGVTYKFKLSSDDEPDETYIPQIEKNSESVDESGQENTNQSETSDYDIAPESNNESGYTVVIQSVESGKPFFGPLKEIKDENIYLFQNSTVVKDVERIRLCAGLFSTLDEATKLKDYMVMKYKISSAWVLKLSDVQQTTSPERILSMINNGEANVVFQGTFTNPSYDLYITDDDILFTGKDRKLSYNLITKFDPSKKFQMIKYIDGAGKINDDLIIINKPSGDGVSSRKYPYSIKYKSLNVNGGAGDKRLMWSPPNN